ncbi:hypothetical protein SELR_25530 [Selenomonas ruminantium subsp. lactilytica TAM6421]|uniref:Uncharacterized protein n=1 Tax=Selenomonas ruminantium subsp. lactilytica (strain NBRC 103574 / TAM6421) TaxID=927704 RepID=I0GU24_SELRL|nr:hypothetical protein [Selenomonas ruminantium]BAL84261.1 hypothetical protein SELR_25530 [Selenomonas ruminantium subsp. lactilytica TAM6421]
MDVKNLDVMLPHRHEADLKSQQNRLRSIINAVKTGNEDAKGLPPLHTLLSKLDALQGSQELESFKRQTSPAFDVDIRHGEELLPFAQDAYILDLGHSA